MPEGPTIVLLAEQFAQFKNRKVTAAGGYTKMDTSWLEGQTLKGVKTFGKQLLLTFNKHTIRIHLLLFGSVLINDRKKANAKLYLEFGDDIVNCYMVDARIVEGKLPEVYDWRVDIMSPKFSPAHVLSLVKEHPAKPIDEVLMDQDVFAGVGNIIKNESLFLAGIHPDSIVEKIPDDKLKKLVSSVNSFKKVFYKGKKEGNLKQYLRVYKKEKCGPKNEPVEMVVNKHSKRKNYICTTQKLYA